MNEITEEVADEAIQIMHSMVGNAGQETIIIEAELPFLGWIDAAESNGALYDEFVVQMMTALGLDKYNAVDQILDAGYERAAEWIEHMQGGSLINVGVKNGVGGVLRGIASLFGIGR